MGIVYGTYILLFKDQISISIINIQDTVCGSCILLYIFKITYG